MYSMRVSKDISPIFIVVFLVLTHSLVGFLCFKWYLDFVVKSFDPGVIILWVMAICIIIVLDYSIFRSQILLRQLLRFQGSKEGLRIYGPFHHETLLQWDDITCYGTICEQPECMVLFFSNNTNKLASNKDFAQISPHNIVIQFRPETWSELQKWIPHNIQKDLVRAIHSGRSIIFRCK